MLHPAALALDQVLEKSPFGIALFSHAGVYESVNAAYCAIYGYDAPELIGQSITRIFPPEQHARVLALHRRFLDEGGTLSGEWEVVRRDGARLFVLSESVRLLGDDGRLHRLVYISDNTERHLAGLARQASEERLSLVLMGTEDGYFDIDLVTGRRTYSERWWRMLGYAPDAWPLADNHWHRLAHPEDLGRVQHLLDAALAGDARRLEFNVRLRHREGHYLHILTRATIGRDASGRATRLTGANTDLSERVRQELEARHYQLIVQSSEDAIISKSLDSTVTSWNAGAEAMFGYSARDMLGKPSTVLLPPDRLDEEDRILRRLRSGERVEHFETVRIHRSGRPVQVSVTISPVRDPSGAVVGASKIARDITLKKALEAQLLLTASVFAHTQEGIVVTSARGRIIEANPAFEQLGGHARAALLGHGARPLLQVLGLAEAWAPMADALRLHGHYKGEHWGVRHNGQRVALLLTVSAVRGAGGAVQNYVALVSDVTPLRQRQEQLEHLAHHDALTDLPNRVLLADRIRQSMILARRQGLQMALLYIDLDGFKQVNDQHGHAVGDTLLVALAARMKQALREVDTLARIGGDEFAAVLFDIKGREECQPLLARVLHACSAPLAIGGLTVQVSASIGAVLYRHEEASAEQLLAQADAAMYLAKQSGKNRACFADA